jgi:acetolactate synthase-1/2/3 large subunit
MLGMHGTYEANNAMHDCDVMVASARASTTGSPAGSTPSRRLEEDPHRHRPSSINKNVRADIGIVGDAASVLEDMIRSGASLPHKTRPPHRLVDADRWLAGAQLAPLLQNRRQD